MSRFLEGIGFIIRDLRSEGWRSAITLVNLVIFISCYFCLASLAEASVQFGNQSRDSDVLIMITRNIVDLSDSQIVETDFLPIRELIPSQVKSVSPLVLKHLKIDDYFLQVRAAPLEDFMDVHNLSIIDGIMPSGRYEVVISEGIRALTNWKVGDTIRIYGVDFTISGLVRSTGTKFSSIWMSLENADNLFSTSGVYQFAWIVLADNAQAETVIELLGNDPRLSGRYDIFYADQFHKQYSGALQDIEDISSVIVLLSLLSIIFGVYGSTYLVLAERKREITIMRAIGFSSLSLRVMLFLRSIIQVILAYLFSWALTALVIFWFESVSPIIIRSMPMPVFISPKTLLLGAIFSIFFAWIGVWLSTRHLKKGSVSNMIQR